MVDVETEGDLSGRAAVRWLVAIVGLSIGVRIALGALLPAPFFFLDELGYEQMARSLAHSGHFGLYGNGGIAYSPLYPVLLSPIYALTSSARLGWEAVKALNAVLMSLSLFLVYAIARSVLTRRQSVFVAGLTAIAPFMGYSSLELSENAAYPLCLVAVCATLRAVRLPNPRNDLLLLAAIGLASAARLQLVVLVPAAFTAALVVALLDPTEGRGRLAAVGRAVAAHRLFLGVVGVAAIAAILRTIANGGSLPLAGRYSIVGHARPSIPHVARIVINHVAGLDLAVGVLPFACALLCGYLLARCHFPRNALVFGAVAVGLTVWLLVEVGLDAASFDTGKVLLPTGQIRGDVPRFHERYLMYTMPFFFVAFVAAVDLRRRVDHPRVHLLIATCTAVLPAVIPYRAYIGDPLVGETPALQFLATVRGAHLVAISHATITAVIVAALASGIYLFAFTTRHRPLASVVIVATLLVLSAAYAGRVASAGRGSLHLNLSSRDGVWVDRTGARGVMLVSGKGPTRVALLETAFFNFSITRLSYVCWSAFEPDFGEQPLVVGADGRLRDSRGSVRVQYAIVPTRLHMPGRVLAHDRRGRLELIRPANGFLVVPARLRGALGCG